MDDNRKNNIINAIKSFEKKNLPKKTKPRKKKNSAPEAALVKNFLKFAKQHKALFDLNVIEAKAVYNQQAGMYLSGQVASGYPDISGNDKFGHAMFLEAKAPGKRSTLRADQYEFLMRKIEMNCFAICFDSIQYFKDTYKTWHALNIDDRKNYLINELPVPKLLRVQNNDDPLFD